VKRAKSSSSSRRRSKRSRTFDYGIRYRRFLDALKARGVDGFLVNHPPNLFYLFGFSGSAGLAITLDGETSLIVDGRYIEQAVQQAVNCKPLLAPKTPEESLRQLLGRKRSKRRIGVESRHLSFEMGLQLQSWATAHEFLPVPQLVEELRMIKDPGEIQIMLKAFEIAQTAYEQLVPDIQPGKTELQVAGRFEALLRELGAEKASFDTIVASGPRSSLPHGRATAKLIEPSELVLVDFGLVLDGYCSDLTRVHFPPGAKKPVIFDIVREAQQRALATVRPGIQSSDVDRAARDCIAGYGFGDYFSHSTGHGLGLEVHEPPLVSWRLPTILREGMAFTIEPGIYLPGQHGIRLEDVVVVTATGYRLLSDPRR